MGLDDEKRQIRNQKTKQRKKKELYLNNKMNMRLNHHEIKRDGGNNPH